MIIANVTIVLTERIFAHLACIVGVGIISHYININIMPIFLLVASIGCMNSITEKGLSLKVAFVFVINTLYLPKSLICMKSLGFAF